MIIFLELFYFLSLYIFITEGIQFRSHSHIFDNPYQVQVSKYVDTFVLCGGCLITARHVLTAGKCVVTLKNNTVVPDPPEAFTIRVGTAEILLLGKTSKVISIYIRPSFLEKYWEFNKKLTVDDIAGLKSKDIFTLGPRVQVIGIPTQDMGAELTEMQEKNVMCHMIGWGRLSLSRSSSMEPSYVTLLSQEGCKRWENILMIPVDVRIYICTLNLKKSYAAVSGTGLICELRGEKMVWGITSSGFDHFSEGLTFFTRVDTNYDFINAFINKSSISQAASLFLFLTILSLSVS